MTSSPKRAHVFWWKDLERWIVPALQHSAKLPDGWSLVRIGDLVKQVTDKVKVEPNIEYKLAGVRWYGEGVFHRETVMGSDSSATYLMPLIPGAFIYNRLFAWKESFAVVPDELNDCLVSNEFPQFLVNSERLLVRYLYQFCMSKSTLRAVNKASIGSAAVSRNRFKEEFFLNIKIPLPPLSIQTNIVDRWQQAQKGIAAAREKVRLKELEIIESFLSNLGFVLPKISDRKRSLAVWWQDFERWSVSYNQAAVSMIDLAKGKYPLVCMGTVLKMLQYGTSEKANTSGEGVPVVRMNNIVDGELDFSKMKHVVLTAKTINSLLLNKGDILINRTNSKELVGKCGVFQIEGDYVFASYLIRVRVDNRKILPEYLAYVINSPLGRQQVDALSRQIIGQANINSQELRSLQIPMPPLEVQNVIMKLVTEGRTEIAKHREIAQQKSLESKAEVEAMISGTKKIDLLQ
jgi:restriction endonuclease S subunit